MNLPSELYNEITESVTIISRDQPREADRRSPRVRLSSHLAISMWSEPASPLTARIRDLSTGGVGVFHNDRIGLDEQVVITLPLRDNQTVMVLGTVVYWEPLAESLYGVGVQFDRIVDQAEVARRTEETIRAQVNQIGMVARLSQAMARTWRIAS